ncbi:MAG: hypothetical protein GY795_10170, partial [Desulfobacterales bacterium]|nr:hypothetical protein [Desulfobacterales bacterium]
MNILQSKLLVPKTAHAIPRTFLEKMRDDILRKKAVVVCAGPGFGKTTCIAQAVEELDTAWIRIDSTDTDLNVFLTYLISGIRKHYSSFGDAIFRLLAEAGATGVAPDELIRMLLSELESQIHQPFVIVLDDYHQVHTISVIRQSMQFFIVNLPGHIHVIFISRVPVELSLSKLRASLDILDIGTRDLMFSKEETDRLFQETLSTPLSDEQLDLLQERSGGWISGLILFYHSLSGKTGDVSRQLGKLQGTRGFIFDYMDENIFSAIDETLKAFLMKTSVLSHMNAGYCNKLPGIDNAEDILEHLASINMFTFCLDEDKQEYCYHHLFQDFLRKKLEKTMAPAELRLLHSQTAAVLEASGENEEAVRHYLYAESYQDACRVISGIVKLLLRQARLSLINEYLGALPDTVIENEPWILLLRGIKYTFVGRFRESLMDLSTAYDMFIARGDDEGANRCLSDMGRRYYLAGDFYKAEETLKKLMAGRSVELPTRLEALCHLIFISSFLYKFDEADRYIEETESCLTTLAGYISEEVPQGWFKISISLRYWASGDLDRAIEEAGEAHVYLKQLNHFVLLPLYYQIMTMYYHHKASFQEGLDMALAGLELTERMGYRETAMGWILCYAGANSYALGNTDQAIAYGEECVRLFQALESPWGVSTGYSTIQIARLV